MVSIIVPVYKTKMYLEKCVQSLIDQTFQDFEVILVDDGSPDDSGFLCDKLVLKDDRIKVIHKENGGLTSARKAGYNISKGDYIAFVDSDDYVHPRYLEALVNSIERTAAQMSICGYYVVYPTKTTDITLPIERDVIEKKEILNEYILPIVGKICDGNHINLPGFMWLRLYSRNHIRDSYFVSEREFFTEDDIFSVLYAEQIDRIAVVNEPLYYYMQHPESLSNRFREHKWEMLQSRYYFFENILNKYTPNKAVEERLMAAAFSAMFGGIDNAILLNTYAMYKAEVLNIRNSSLYDCVIKRIDKSNLSNTQKIVWYCMQTKTFWILYLYRKWRMMK